MDNWGDSITNGDVSSYELLFDQGYMQLGYNTKYYNKSFLLSSIWICKKSR